MSIKIKTLDSGITILSNKFNSKTLSFGMWLNVGSVNEKNNQFGVAHMLEHMAFKGTELRNASQIAREIEDVGGDINAYTGKEITAYYVKLLPENYLLGIDILSDILINSTFPAGEIERERGVILSEIGMYNDDPYDKVFENFMKTAFKGQSLGESILGTKDAVKGFTKDDLKNFFQRHYNSENLIIGVCGDIDENKIEKEIEEKFKFLRKGKKSLKPKYQWKNGKNLQEKDIEQSHVVFGLEGLNNTHKDRFALRALSIIFGGGMSSRLFQKIRENKGLCYSIYSTAQNYSSTGVFGFYSGCSPKDLDNLLNASLLELKQLRDTISSEEVEKAKSQLKAGILMARDSSMNRLEMDVRSFLTQRKIFSTADTIKEIESLSVSKIENVLSKILENPQPVLSILGPNSNDFKNTDINTLI